MRLLGIKQGVLKGDENPDDDEEEEEEPQGVAAPEPHPVANPAAATDLPFMYRNAIADDPKLSQMGVSSIEELHAAMAKLSAEIPADADGSYWKQVTFSGKHPYPIFEPNRIKKQYGMDSHTAIIDYYRYAIKDEKHVKDALEFLSDDKPSFIMEGLYHGGFKCQLYHDQLKELDVRCIINTALGCGTFAKNWDKHVAENKKFAVVMDLDWQDDPQQVIHWEVLLGALELIDDTRRAGHSCLVHCMQGKSRSGAVVVAYVAAKENMKLRDALVLVQKHRSQAEPNSGFWNQLVQFERDNLFKRLNEKWEGK